MNGVNVSVCEFLSSCPLQLAKRNNWSDGAQNCIADICCKPIMERKGLQSVGEVVSECLGILFSKQKETRV